MTTPFQAAQEITAELTGTYDKVTYDEVNREYAHNPYVLQFVEIEHNGETVLLSVSDYKNVSVGMKVNQGRKVWDYRDYTTHRGWTRRLAHLLGR